MCRARIPLVWGWHLIQRRAEPMNPTSKDALEKERSAIEAIEHDLSLNLSWRRSSREDDSGSSASTARRQRHLSQSGDYHSVSRFKSVHAATPQNLSAFLLDVCAQTHAIILLSTVLLREPARQGKNLGFQSFSKLKRGPITDSLPIRYIKIKKAKRISDYWLAEENEQRCGK